MSLFLAPRTARMISSSLICTASPSRFWLFWITNTMRNVQMVVPVLMMSCQPSEYPKKGPHAAQTTTLPAAIAKNEWVTCMFRDRGGEMAEAGLP